MEKLSKTEQSQADVPTISQMLLKYLRPPYHLVKSVGIYLLHQVVSSLLAVMLVLWSYLCWHIFFFLTIMGILKKLYWRGIYIPKTEKLSDLPHVLRAKLQFSLTSTELEIKNSARLLKEALKKEKNSEENF